jgi:hypothetical protein
MPHPIAPTTDKRGITVLGLVLLIIALAIAAVLLIRYLREGSATAVIQSGARNLASAFAVLGE